MIAMISNDAYVCKFATTSMYYPINTSISLSLLYFLCSIIIHPVKIINTSHDKLNLP